MTVFSQQLRVFTRLIEVIYKETNNLGINMVIYSSETTQMSNTKINSSLFDFLFFCMCFVAIFICLKYSSLYSKLTCVRFDTRTRFQQRAVVASRLLHSCFLHSGYFIWQNETKIKWLHTIQLRYVATVTS